MRAHGCTWVVVADGGRARVLEERRQGQALLERIAFAHSESDDVYPRDKPTRVRESVGLARHAVTRRTTPHDEGERRFLSRVAARLEQGGAHREFERLILFAPPRALGVLRQVLSERTARLVSAAAPLDIVDADIASIAEQVQQLRQDSST